MVVITEPFWPIVRAFAPTVGAPGYSSIVALPHPVSTKGADELAQLAAGAAMAVAARLTQP